MTPRPERLAAVGPAPAGPVARRRSRSALLGAVLPAVLLLAGLAVAPAEAASDSRPYIVLLRDGSDVSAAVARSRRATGRQPANVYRAALRGYATSLTAGQRRRLARDRAVEAIVPDAVVRLTGQVVPAGIRRIGATETRATHIDGSDVRSHRVNADIAIIDTGIARHPDLNVAGGYNCTSSDRSAWGDRNGHGTHVAGTAAAIDNGFGVVGAAPGARLWAVRVFRPDGYSRISWIVCGIDWITRQRDPLDPSRPRIEVANMSLRDAGRDDGRCGYANADPEHRAICRSVAAGTTYVVSAGNDRRSASLWRPASYDEVVTVSAIADFDGRPGGQGSAPCTSFGRRDIDDTFADFSNYGADVDITAPGVCVRSTIPGGYGWISGTSMSTPAVAGAAAVYAAAHAGATPAEIRAALRGMGTYDWRTGTDPDGRPEPLLDMRSIGAGPGFDLRPMVASVRAWTGVGSSSVGVRVARLDGFGGTISLDVAGLPRGVTAAWTAARLEGLERIYSKVTFIASHEATPGTYAVTLRGRAGDLADEQAVTLTVARDDTPPVVTAPRPTVAQGSIVGAAATTRLIWSARDAGTGVERIGLHERRGSGDWVAVPLGSPVVGSASRTLAFGSSTTYRMTATDRSGNASVVTSAPVVPRAGSEAGATYGGTWRTSWNRYWWGGRTRYATRAGATATYRFTGRAVGIVAPYGPGRGRAKVYVDGRYVRTIDLYSSRLRGRRVVFERSWASAGTHTVRLVVVGTSGRPRVDLDGFVVMP